MKKKAQPDEIIFSALGIRSSKGDVKIEISNLTSIPDLKRLYVEKLGTKDVKGDDFRFFCLGKELRDDLFLYSYDL